MVGSNCAGNRKGKNKKYRKKLRNTGQRWGKKSQTSFKRTPLMAPGGDGNRQFKRGPLVSKKTPNEKWGGGDWSLFG